MKVTPLAIPEVLLIEPKVFGDSRGFFFESYNQNSFNEATGLDIRFVQDNHSRSAKGVLRGLHYQLPPRGQGKLVRVTAGEVYDVAVDMRPQSPTLGQWVGAHLSGANNAQLWVPPGFAHGFAVLSDSADFLYKVTDTWSQAHERALRWDDPFVAIDWPVSDPQVSEKDARAMFWAEAYAEMESLERQASSAA